MRLQMSTLQVKKIAGGVAGTVAATILVLTAILAPSESQIRAEFERQGVYIFHRGHVGASPYTTLDEIFIACSVSVASSSGQCSIAPNGSNLRIGFARLPTITGEREIAMRARAGEDLIYNLSPQAIRSNWIKASLWDAMFYAAMAGIVAFAMIHAINHPPEGEK